MRARRGSKAGCVECSAKPAMATGFALHSNGAAQTVEDVEMRTAYERIEAALPRYRAMADRADRVS